MGLHLHPPACRALQGRTPQLPLLIVYTAPLAHMEIVIAEAAAAAAAEAEHSATVQIKKAGALSAIQVHIALDYMVVYILEQTNLLD